MSAALAQVTKAFYQSFRCAILGSNVQVPIHGSFSPDALRACIRANFAASKDASVQEQGPLLDRAFAALRILSEQMHMQQCSSHAVTGGIQVEVTSAFIGVNIFSTISSSTELG